MSLSAVRILFFSLLSFSFQWSDIFPGKNCDHGGFSVITYNVGNVNEAFPTPAEVFEVLITPLPDVLLLQEVRTRDFVAELAALYAQAAGKPVDFEYFQVGNGVAIISAYPFGHRGLIPGTDLYGGGFAVCEINGVHVLLCTVHLPYIPKERDREGQVSMSPGSLIPTVLEEFLADTPRSRLMDELLPWITDHPADSKIVAGDFNTIPFSRVQTVMQRGFTDSLYLKRDYLSSSYRKISMPFGTRADYIFASGELCATESFVIPDSKGDHYPVYARYVWKQGE